MSMATNGTKRIDGIEYLLDLNKRHSQRFSSEVERGERRLYRHRHPLEIIAFKCMDGRLNLSVMTKTAPGIIQPMRNVGAKFRLGWPFMRETMGEHYEYAQKQGRACLVIASYHYSRGDTHRGCAGFNGDVDAARAFASGLKKQHVKVFGNGAAFYTILVGLETDLDALILHSDDEAETIDLSTLTDASPKNVEELLRRLYPKMSQEMIRDFLPLVVGNIDHIQEIRAANRPVEDITHREWVLAFGRGFDWFHEPNTAIVVGPFDPDLRKPIATGASLLLRNLNEGRISRDTGVVLVSSAPYRYRAGYDKAAAIEKAYWHNEYAMEVITEEVPDLLPYLKQLTAVMDMETRSLEVLARTNTSVPVVF